MIPKKLKLEGDQGSLIGPQKEGRLQCAIDVVNIWINAGEKEVLSQKGKMHDVSMVELNQPFSTVYSTRLWRLKTWTNYLPYP